MSSPSTPSDSRQDTGPTPVQKGMKHARRAVKQGVKLGRKHGPVVARKTAVGLKHAGEAIRDSEHTRKMAKTGKKAGKAAGRAVKGTFEKHPWMATAAKRIADTTSRVTKATHEHLVEKRYFEKSLKALDKQVKRYPGIENAWNQTRHAFSMGPESSMTNAPGPMTKKSTTKKTTGKKTAARKTTTKKKTTAKKKSTTKKKTNRAA